MLIERMFTSAKLRAERFEQKVCVALKQPVPFFHRGRRYHVNPERAAAYHIRQSVSKVQRLVDVLQNPPDVVLDVGANCGLFGAFVLQRYADARVHCFEPSSELSPLIGMNCGSNAVVNQCCVGENDGSCELFVNEASQQTNSTVLSAVEPFAQGHIKSRSVPQCSLDTYCMKHGIDRVSVLKLDVQGAEGGVLRGARRILPSVDVLFIECTWLDLEAVHQFIPFARAYEFEHITVVNPVYTGADLALSRAELLSLDKKTLRFRLSEASQIRPWV